MGTFDEAYKASEAMLAERQAAEAAQIPPEAVPAEVAPETVPATEAIPAEGQAPAAAPMTEAQILQEAALRTANELAAVKNELEQLKALSAQQSQAADTQIQEELLEPPKLDMSGYAYLSDEDIASRVEEYTNKKVEFALGEYDKKLNPIVGQYEQQTMASEEQAVLNDLRMKSPDFDTYLPEIQGFLGADNIIAKALSTLPARERYVTASLMAKGAAPVQQETAEQLVKKIAANPDAMRMLELQRVEAAKKNANIPPQSASSGMANIPVTPQQTPRTIEEGYNMAKAKYGW